MSSAYVIPLDTHCQSTEFRVMSPSGRFVRAGRCPTTIPALTELLTSVRRPRHVVLEEGPLADWLLRNLRPHADEVVVCDPRRNALIGKESDKDDPIDAEKLGQLYRGGFVRPVHHAESFERAVFKQLVALYHDRVRNRTRLVNPHPRPVATAWCVRPARGRGRGAPAADAGAPADQQDGSRVRAALAE